jgi:F-type H+-transporting ATPase subunit a
VDLTLSPDSIVYWQWGFINLNATIVFTWIVMAILVGGSWLITRNLSSNPDVSRWQSLLEIVVLAIQDQIREITNSREVNRYLPFIGSLFLLISVANLLAMVPGYEPPTSSLSTASALALCVFFAVPIYGIAERGFTGYFKRYLQPSPVILPFHIISELSRTLALAIRLFGNMISGTLIVAILLSIVPLFLPVLMEAFGLLIGQIQAYIFAVLAMVFIVSAVEAHEKEEEEIEEETKKAKKK